MTKGHKNGFKVLMYIKDWMPTQNDRLCSKHFEKKLFYHIGDKTCLLDDAVPTIFLELPKYIQTVAIKKVLKDFKL